MWFCFPGYNPGSWNCYGWLCFKGRACYRNFGQSVCKNLAGDVSPKKLEGEKPQVPDILANAGGVVVSYFEWVQNIQSLMLDEEEVNRALEKIMIRAFNEVWDKAHEKETTLRLGAYMVAIDRVVKAKKIRGVFP